MGDIQFHNEKILFDNEKIAFDPACCCGCEGCACLDIVIAAVVRDSPCDCSECYSLNGSYQVSQTAPGRCAWSGYLCDLSASDPYKKCHAGGLLVSITKVGSNWYLRASITGSYGLPPPDHTPFSILFEKDLGTSAPDCTVLSSEVCTYVSGNTEGTCDFSGATLTVSYQAGACDTGDSCDDRPERCELCYDGMQPEILEVTFPDKFNQSAGCKQPVSGSRCGESGTYLLEHGGGTGCGWTYIEGPSEECSDFNVYAQLVQSGADIYLVVAVIRFCDTFVAGSAAAFHRWVKNVSDDYMDCDNDLDCFFDGDVVSIPFDCEGLQVAGCTGNPLSPTGDCDPDNCGMACCNWTDNTAITVEAKA